MTVKKDEAPSKFGTANLFFPVKAIGRASKSVVDTKTALVDMVKQFRDNLPEQETVESDDPRVITDPRMRFEVLYEMNGWSAEELETQRKAVRRTKITSLIMCVLAFCAVVVGLLVAPVWMLLFAMPAAGCLLILSLAQVFKYAHFQAQIELRQLISAREFASLPDFFSRLIK